MQVCMQEHYTLIRQCQQVHLSALQSGDLDLQQHCQKCVQQWQAVMEDAIDAQTAAILQVGYTASHGHMTPCKFPFGNSSSTMCKLEHLELSCIDQSITAAISLVLYC